MKQFFLLTLLLLSFPAAAAQQLISLALSEKLTAVNSPEDVAELVHANPDFAAVLMTEAAILGVASPSAVLRTALTPDTDCALTRRLVFAAALAAPREADVTSEAAFRATAGSLDCHLEGIAQGSVDAVELADLPQAELDAELAEIVSVLKNLAPARVDLLADAIATATDRTDDTAASVLGAADGGIETADVAPSGLLPPTTLPAAVNAGNLPSETQDNPSPN